jgi:hypothetical protein
MNKYFFSSGTDALLFLFNKVKSENSKIYVPEFACSQVYSALLTSNVIFELYPLNKNYEVPEFFIDFLNSITKENVYLLIVSNFGNSPYDNNILKKYINLLNKQNINVIEDYALNTPLEYHFYFNNHIKDRYYRIHSFGYSKPTSLVQGGIIYTNVNLNYNEILNTNILINFIYILKLFFTSFIRNFFLLFILVKRLKPRKKAQIEIVNTSSLIQFNYLFMKFISNSLNFRQFKTQSKYIKFNTYQKISEFIPNYNIRLIYIFKSKYNFLK